MITLRGMTWDHPRGYAPLDASATAYAEPNGITVTWERRSLKDFGDVPIDELASRYDLLIIDHPHVGLAATSRAVLPLDEWIDPATMATLKAESAGPSHASYTYKGHQWALAIDAAFQTSSYRPDLMAETFPHSWDETLQLAERLRTRNLWLGFPLCPTDAVCSFLTLCASLGDELGREDGSFVGREVGLQALQLLAAFAKVAHPASLDWNPIRLYDHMRDADPDGGDAVAYCPLAFGYTNYARADSLPYLIRFHDIPGINGALLGGTGFAVSANCQHPHEAVAYGLWLCSAETQRGFYVEEGGQPGNGVAWQDDAANTLTNHFFRDTWATLQAAYVRPRHARFVTHFQEPAGEVINSYLRHGGNVEACFDVLTRLYEESLG